MKKIMFVLFLLLITTNAFATTRYVSPTGSGSTCSDGSPCSLNTGISQTTAGDTLYLKDGTYNQQLNINVSGTVGNYVTVAAQNDGQAIISSNDTYIACQIVSQSYINLEGIICQDANNDAPLTISNSSYINVKRVTGRNMLDTVMRGGIALVYSDYVLLEDCLAYGKSRVLINDTEGDYNTIRRCTVLWSDYVSGTSGMYGIQLYASNNTTVENNVVKQLDKNKYATGYMQGIRLWSHYYNRTVGLRNNKVYGNVVYNYAGWAYYDGSCKHRAAGNIHLNNVAIDSDRIFYQKGDADLIINQITGNLPSDVLTRWPDGNPIYAMGVDSQAECYPHDSDWANNGTIKNSVFLDVQSEPSMQNTTSGTVTSKYNSFYNCSSPLYYGSILDKTGDNTTNPTYNTTTYGKGGYLIRSSALAGTGESGVDRGAEVLYRYVDGVLTGTALWPWPMEARVCAETGYSVTFENSYSGCANGGGLWKTLSGVYETGGSAPALPGDTTITPTVVSYSRVDLDWNAATDVDDDLAGYEIERCADDCDNCPSPTAFANVGSTYTDAYSDGTEFGDGTLTCNTKYCWRARAFDSDSPVNYSGYYSEAEATTSACPSSAKGHHGPQDTYAS